MADAFDVVLPTPGQKPWNLNPAIEEIRGRVSETDDVIETGRLSAGALTGEFVSLTAAAKSPDLLVTGVITRDSNQAITSADVTWPDGTPGIFTSDTLSVAFPGAVDGYHITYGSPVSKTYTQPTITRNSSGAAIAVPQIVVT